MQDAATSTVPGPVADLVGVLCTALVLSAGDDKWTKQDKRVTIQYELLHEQDVYPYYSWLDGSEWAFKPGSLPDDETDIIVRTEATILGDILSGRLDGREAITSGKMSLRKAPPMPMLMVMRGIFMRYAKAQARGLVPSAWGSVDFSEPPTCREDEPASGQQPLSGEGRELPAGATRP
jgi:putative sterol carrier protein